MIGHEDRISKYVGSYILAVVLTSRHVQGNCARSSIINCPRKLRSRVVDSYKCLAKPDRLPNMVATRLNTYLVQRVTLILRLLAWDGVLLGDWGSVQLDYYSYSYSVSLFLGSAGRVESV